MYLLDTDILSNLVRRTPSVALVTKLEQVPVDLQHISSITVGELIYGASRLGEQGAPLMRRIEEVLRVHITVVPFDVRSARRYGTLRADLERRGVPIGDGDMGIAAIALTHGLTVVNGNVRHFQRVPGLTVENWLL